MKPLNEDKITINRLSGQLQQRMEFILDLSYVTMHYRWGPKKEKREKGKMDENCHSID